ncbi:alanine--tRNA ligase [Blattabacterium cuenoti]|uniref:alanine--tRNA ligase n=1 Tax=Blattabacterium cuenoti TaxID=1653831 RepID=UPI00163B6622|nr:alanine--tRNA ligase [Blattabacterium cuenoti]
MKYTTIKNRFLDFFQKKQHKIISSYPIFSENDPSLFFVNAGMNPFKDYFLGNRIPKYSRIANIQKCLRIDGKHNDLKHVGYDSYHHTLFEMLGNWSFGDYSREKAIKWAWDLLINVYNIPKKNMYISIFVGDKKDNLSLDKETLTYWSLLVDKDHILFFGKQDNFWEMGETGPCGPCTEIHVDIRSEKEKKMISGKNLINQNNPGVIEIWNIVFIEFFRKLDGTLEYLSKKHVDTGMGLERICMVLQEKSSSYDTDLFLPIIQDIKKYVHEKTSNELYQKITIQMISDHLRAIICSILDGQLPSNNGAGYVIRKILRRSIIYMNRFLGKENPFIYQFVDSFSKKMKDYFPLLEHKKNYIKQVIEEEEISFLNVIKRGNKKIQHVIKKYKEQNENIISGKIIFQLYDTYGYPFELSKIIAHKNNLLIDEKLFQKKLLEQKKRSRKKDKIIKKDWIRINHHISISDENHFVGYDCIRCNIFIIKYRKVINNLENNHYYELVFSHTPFYPIGGGQLCDIGYIKNQFNKVVIFDVKKENSIIIHLARVLPINIKNSFQAVVNQNRRSKIEKNHTSTHLLYFALKKILGKHVQQKGSYIGENYLRFDFYHFKKITLIELQNIEILVQDMIIQNIPMKEKKFNTLKEAKKYMDLYQGSFENKYPNQQIRIVNFGDSHEFCIGTHVKNTGLIHLFKILSDRSISYGIRRIKAITSDKAIQYIRNICNEYQSLMITMNNPKSIENSISYLKNQNKNFKKEISKLHVQFIKILKKKYISKIVSLKNMKYILDFNFYKESNNNFDLNMIRKTILLLKKDIQNLFMVVGFVKDKKSIVFISISDSVIKMKNIHACKIMKKIQHHICGKCWGDSAFSTAIGTKIDGLSLLHDDIMIYLKKNVLH